VAVVPPRFPSRYVVKTRVAAARPHPAHLPARAADGITTIICSSCNWGREGGREGGREERERERETPSARGHETVLSVAP